MYEALSAFNPSTRSLARFAHATTTLLGSYAFTWGFTAFDIAWLMLLAAAAAIVAMTLAWRAHWLRRLWHG